MSKEPPDIHELVRMKLEPSRTNGNKTKNAILASTGHLLQEVGFERLSTNMICQHAGITPPALYRYFPNKYAVLFELAHGLLIAQRAALNVWLGEDGFGWSDRASGLARINRLQVALRGVADERLGAIWIMRAMRSVPILREVRTIAQRRMLDDLTAGLSAAYPGMSPAGLVIPVRLVNEIVNMGTELEMDDPTLDAGCLHDGISLAIVSYLEALSATDD